jgi:serine/threonine protein kinase
VTNADIENETRAIIQLSAGHENVVSVLEHGWLDGPFRCYYFDMDLCDCDLETYIYGDRSFLFDDCSKDVFTTIVRKGDLVMMTVKNIWAIVDCISKGLIFIHGHKQVHRDLKPSNSTVLDFPY